MGNCRISLENNGRLLRNFAWFLITCSTSTFICYLHVCARHQCMKLKRFPTSTYIFSALFLFILELFLSGKVCFFSLPLTHTSFLSCFFSVCWCYVCRSFHLNFVCCLLLQGDGRLRLLFISNRRNFSYICSWSVSLCGLFTFNLYWCCRWRWLWCWYWFFLPFVSSLHSRNIYTFRSYLKFLGSFFNLLDCCLPTSTTWIHSTYGNFHLFFPHSNRVRWRARSLPFSIP